MRHAASRWGRSPAPGGHAHVICCSASSGRLDPICFICGGGTGHALSAYCVPTHAQEPSHKARLTLLTHMVEEEQKRLQARVSLKSLFSSSSE
jgi:hypothetical protein